MTMRSQVPLLITAMACLIGWSMSARALTVSVAEVAPGSTSPPNPDLVSGFGTAVQSIDTGTVVFPNGAFNTRAYVDPVNGILRSAAGTDGLTLNSASDVGAAIAGSTLAATMNLYGPGTSPVDVYVMMDFDGVLNGDSRTQLVGEVGALVGSTDYHSLLSFDMNPQDSSLGGTVEVLTDFTSADAKPIVLSMAPGSLQGRVLLPLSMRPGESAAISWGLTASVGFGADYGAPPETGSVDAWNTARISFLVPDGYSFIADDGAMGGVPVSAVPLPAAGWLLLSGVGLIGGLSRNGRARPIT